MDFGEMPSPVKMQLSAAMQSLQIMPLQGVMPMSAIMPLMTGHAIAQDDASYLRRIAHGKKLCLRLCRDSAG